MTRDLRHCCAAFVGALTCATLLLVATSAQGAYDGTIETYVGGGNGDGSFAVDAVIDPRGVLLVTDSTGVDAYIADGFNNRVRHVDGASGIITTIAGNGVKGFSGDGGQAQNASLALPMDVARDAAGNLFIAERDNNRIRKVAPNGIISTFAGNGTLGFGGDGGLATQATLYNPRGVAIGPDGYVYVADAGNNRIRAIGPPNCGPSTCIISTVAGTGTAGYSGDFGPALSAAMNTPSGIAFDAAGNMLIADRQNQVVRRIVSGRMEPFAGGGTIGILGNIGDNGPAIGAVLRLPEKIAVDRSGAVYITDTLQRRLRKVVNGIITTVAGDGSSGFGGDGGPATQADMALPYGVAVSPSGEIWISTSTDLIPPSRNNRVRKVDLVQNIHTVVGGGLADGAPAGEVFVDPHGAEVVNGAGPLPDLYFADTANNVVRYFAGSDGTIHVFAGTGDSGYSGDNGRATDARLKGPWDVAVDRNGNVFIADTSNNVVRRVDTRGTITTVAGTGTRGFSGDGGPATQAQISPPNGIAVDANGALYIADYTNNRVRKVSNGIITTVAGNGQSGFGGDGGPATAASLRNPFDVAVADDGTIYIADAFNYRIRRVAPNGIITTYAGIGVSGSAGDGGPATQARLYTPTLLTLDDANNLFINDSVNLRVRIVSYSSGIIDTVAGNGEADFGGDGGPARAASFSSLTGVAIDPFGARLFVSSKDDYRVRLVTFPGLLPTSTPTATSIPASPTRTPIASTPTRTFTPRSNTPGATSGSIFGRVTYYSNNSPVSNVQVGFSGPQSFSVMTNGAGNYTTSNLALGDWTVTPTKNGGVGNAVSSLDAARVLQTIAGLVTFTPLQRLACDVTGDGNLSALDAVRILQYSAGVVGDLPLSTTCGSDWIFYPSPDPAPYQQTTPPLMGPGSCQRGSIFLPLTSEFNIAGNQDFDALVIGDCTGNWNPSAGALRQAAGANSTTVATGALRSRRAHTYQLPIYVESSEPFNAFEMTLKYNPSVLALRSVEPHGTASEALTGVRNDDGTLTVTLANGAEMDGSGGAVLVVEFLGDTDAGDAGIELVRARVDEQSAGLINRSDD